MIRLFFLYLKYVFAIEKTPEQNKLFFKSLTLYKDIYLYENVSTPQSSTR